MYPTLYIFGYPISLYYLTIILANILGCLWVIRFSAKKNLSDTKICGLLWVILLSWPLGSRLLAVLSMRPTWFIENPLQALAFWNGGWHFYGGVMMGFLVVCFYCRVSNLPLAKVLDMLSMALMLSLALGRLACLFEGCCFGKITTLPWGIYYPTEHAHAHLAGSVRHPVPLYASIAALMIFFYARRIEHMRYFRSGTIFIMVMTLYACNRFIQELFRDDPRGHLLGSVLTPSQWLAVATLLACWVGCYYRGRTRSAILTRSFKPDISSANIFKV